MASKNDITGFTIESYGNVKIKCYQDRGEITHEYYGVPVEIIKKFINASKAPTLKEFDDWLDTYREKQNNNKSGNIIGQTDCSFWHRDN